MIEAVFRIVRGQACARECQSGPEGGLGDMEDHAMQYVLKRVRGFVLVMAVLGLMVSTSATATAAEQSATDSRQQGIRVNEPFTVKVLTDGLDFPWEMLWGPDDMLWVTERHGLRITRVDPQTGEKTVVGRIAEAYPGPQHEGVLGMAFAPNFLKGGSDNYLYALLSNNN